MTKQIMGTLKAGKVITGNHNQVAMKVRMGIIIHDIWGGNHNETALKVRKGVIIHDVRGNNHNQTTLKVNK